MSGVTLYLIRHGHAGNKHNWSGPDELRPLSTKGRAQAERIADQFGHDGITRVISSPALRCRQTVEPLAEQLNLKVEDDDALAEGTPARRALELLLGVVAEGGDAALCSHGDVIPALVQALEADGLAGDGHTASAKAGAFILDTEDGRISHALYVPPPDVRALNG